MAQASELDREGILAVGCRNVTLFNRLATESTYN